MHESQAEQWLDHGGQYCSPDESYWLTCVTVFEFDNVRSAHCDRIEMRNLRTFRYRFD